MEKDVGTDTVADKGGVKEQLTLKLDKGRYSKGKKKKHRGGRNQRRKQGFLSDEDFEDAPIPEGSGAGVIVGMGGLPSAAPEGSGEGTTGGMGGLPSAAPDDNREAGSYAHKNGEEEAEKEEDEEADDETLEETQETTSRRMSKTRRRTYVATVEEGRLRREVMGPARGRRAPNQMSRVWPRRDEIISQAMADPNRNKIGYRSQEVPVANARTSGVFWSSARTRDNGRFPGTAEKTLPRQSLESVSAGGIRGGEAGEDLLLWPGVRPPDVGPR